MNVKHVWIASALLLAACGGGGESGGEAEKAQSDSITSTTAAPPPGGDTTPAMAQADSHAHGGDHSHSSASNPTVQLQQIGNSGITGQAQLMAHGEQTMVVVTLTGPGSGAHPGHVHQGTCDKLGTVVAPLQAVERANGNGTSTTTIQVPMATVMNGQHVVNYHAGTGANPMAPVACGQIPAQGGNTSGQAM